MNTRNLIVVASMLLATLTSFFLGEYHTLKPYLFLAGLAVTSFIGAWAAVRMETRDLVVLFIVSSTVAVFDEYAHTSAKAFTYFDGGVPSPLAVFGSGLFVITILAVTRLLNEKFVLGDGSVSLRILPVSVTLKLLFLTAWFQGYLSVFSSLLVAIYIVMGAICINYSYSHPPGWNTWLILCGVGFGALMEFVGGMEGLWVYHFSEPLPLYLTFTWALRAMTVHAICTALNVESTESF
ncbi:MAG: hypothetical protein JSV27_12300 [Candidatus Bathyarchaeota archaeon]|nr:MAG: hypothetical protein JSV27_12300 [Candidatus Bathyarchaeota archaeon]